MSTEIIISELQNEYDALVAEVQKLKDEIADLTAEKDDLELHICRELKAEYEEFTRLTNEAHAITADIDARYDALAKAEAYLIEHVLALPTYYNKTWQLTCVNDSSKIYSLYGVQSTRYINWETNDQIYTVDEYAEFLK